MQSLLCIDPCCHRGSLLHYKNEEQISCAVHSLCCSSLSQRQSCPIQKRGASVLRGSPYSENCACGKPQTSFIHKMATDNPNKVNSFHNPLIVSLCRRKNTGYHEISKTYEYKSVLCLLFNRPGQSQGLLYKHLCQ